MTVSDVKVGRAAGGFAVGTVSQLAEPIFIGVIETAGYCTVKVAIRLAAGSRNLSRQFIECITHARPAAKPCGGVDRGVPVGHPSQFVTLCLIGSEILGNQSNSHRGGIAQKAIRQIPGIKCLRTLIGELLQGLGQSSELNYRRCSGPVPHGYLTIREVN